MPAFLVKLDAGLSGRTLHNGVDAVIVFANDDEEALDVVQERFPGLTGWASAEVTDLSALADGDPDAVPPVDPAEGIFAELRQT